MVHEESRLLAGSDGPDDAQERAAELPEVSISVLQLHLARQLPARPFVHLMNLIAMLAASEVCLLFHPALFYEPFVLPTIWSLTGCASRS